MERYAGQWCVFSLLKTSTVLLVKIYRRDISNASLQQTCIERSGSKFTTRTLHCSEYLTELKKKLEEDMQEFWS